MRRRGANRGGVGSPSGKARAHLVAALCLLALGCAYAGQSKPGGTPEDDFASAKREYDEGHYYDAVQKLEAFIAEHPGSVLVDQAIFTLGQSYEAQKDWVMAATQYERLVRDFPESRSTCDADFFLGRCYWRQSRRAPYDQSETRRALDQLHRFEARCPEHSAIGAADSLIRLAEDRLAEKEYRAAELYRRRKERESAIVYCDLVVDEFPNTRWACPARLMRADLLLYQSRVEDARADMEWITAHCPDLPKDEIDQVKRRLEAWKQ
jgi:outer membrane protein assembly factor BamD